MSRTFKLGSEISDLEPMRLWLDVLIKEHTINDKTAFAIRICLEETLSNVIRHGYKNLPGHSIDVRFHKPEKTRYAFIFEDQAPHFSPLEAKIVSPLERIHAASGPVDLELLRTGRLGLMILSKYASDIRYEALPVGNRLTLTFSD